VTRRDDRGQSTVELALALPVVVLLVLGLIQIALILRDHLLVVHAAREAVRAAVVVPTVDRTDAARRGATSAGPLDADRVRTTGEVLDGGERLRVRVDYASRTDLPLIGALVPDLQLSAEATMRIEMDR
jgi:Flp pilus assembly protein TadG